MYVIVVGGGKVGYFLTKYLQKDNEVTLIEKNIERFRYLEDQIGDNVFYGDGSEINTLKMSGIERADAVVALTGHDEDNIIICQMAKEMFKTKKVVGRINNPKNEDTFKLLNIDNFVNSTKLIYQLVEEEAGLSNIIPLIHLKGKADIIEFIIEPESKVVGKSLKDLSLPNNAIVISIYRNDKLEFPKGNTTFEINDNVFVLTSSNNIDNIKTYFL